MGPAIGLAILVTLIGMLRKKGAPAWSRWGAALAAPIPFVAMFWFHGLGPLLREPSPGAIDNGGSVVALLRLGDRLSARPVGEPVGTTSPDVRHAASCAAVQRARRAACWGVNPEVAPSVDVVVPLPPLAPALSGFTEHPLERAAAH